MVEEYIIQLKMTSILNVPYQIYEKDFIFIVNGEEFHTSHLISDLLSPKISQYHKNDPTMNKYYINTETRGDFSKILELVNFEHNSILDHEIPFFIEIIEKLGTNSILISNFNDNTKTNNDNIFKKLKMSEIVTSQINDELIEYIASHFFELCTKCETEMKSLHLNTLVSIVNHPKLRLKNEDQLIQFINSIYSIHKEYSILYEAVLFSNAEKIAISEFIEVFDINDITSQIWYNLSQRLQDDVSLNKNEPESEQEIENETENRYETPKIKLLNFVAENDDEFNGIIRYLHKHCKIENAIKVTSSSVNGNFFASNVTNYENKNKWFHSQNQPNNWICFDFIERRVKPTNYKIRSSLYSANSFNPKSWNIEGSNDKINWVILSEVKDSPDLNNKHVVHLFPIENSDFKYYRYVRMRMTGPNWNNNNYLMLDSFEIYGKLID